jgi:hypothetical protein
MICNTAADLTAAGLTAAGLTAAGLTAADLTAAGLTAAYSAAYSAVYSRWYDALDERDAARVAYDEAVDNRFGSTAYNRLYNCQLAVEALEMALDAVRVAIA